MGVMPDDTDPPAPAACYGLVCPQRGTCGLYAALGLDDGPVIDSCQTRGDWPLYRPAGEP
jgi:hypothetical protein